MIQPSLSLLPDEFCRGTRPTKLRMGARISKLRRISNGCRQSRSREDTYAGDRRQPLTDFALAMPCLDPFIELTDLVLQSIQLRDQRRQGSPADHRNIKLTTPQEVTQASRARDSQKSRSGRPPGKRSDQNSRTLEKTPRACHPYRRNCPSSNSSSSRRSKRSFTAFRLAGDRLFRLA